MASNQTELRTLKKMITQANHILDTTPALPQNRTAACQELLQQLALALTDDLLSQAKLPAASQLGSKGGSATARRHGPEHIHRQMAAKTQVPRWRKTPQRNRVVFIHKSAIYRT